jgi:hypothetical protein
MRDDDKLVASTIRNIVNTLSKNGRRRDGRGMGRSIGEPRAASRRAQRTAPTAKNLALNDPRVTQPRRRQDSCGTPIDPRPRMGHVPQTVGERHYTDTDPSLWRDAVPKIVLDLTTVPAGAKVSNVDAQLSDELSEGRDAECR